MENLCRQKERVYVIQFKNRSNQENFDDKSDFIATKGDGGGPKDPPTCSVKKNILGEIRSYTFTCARAGKCDNTGEKPLDPQVTTKCQFPARIMIRLDTLVGYVISKVDLVYNHPLNPDDSRFFRCNRYISAHVMNQIDLFDRAGVRVNKVYNICRNEHGGPENMTCTPKDCINMVDKLRRIRLEEGDAAAILKYFANMSMQNSGFYYKVDLDNDGYLDKVFWADGRYREAYKEFGEVISFDTTYLVNKYNMPFAPFVGVNHHGQSILFGCGLVSHEDKDSFAW
ncbi:protein FAR-RED IMPAIRED RESPONSE 1-like [Papaver somniferum]|uniref:protein FAR-RED IMPAIRED RESPONSE 1-like n=1 Tax=Papaver somniferum TaxID=3469 RepID=UPI000E6F686D|nr:protein FAR-RED IMPAIRED RESPONSE 1-like [Papaver somniferum]